VTDTCLIRGPIDWPVRFLKQGLDFVEYHERRLSKSSPLVSLEMLSARRSRRATAGDCEPLEAAETQSPSVTPILSEADPL
jgi:hypothetical protein